MHIMLITNFGNLLMSKYLFHSSSLLANNIFGEFQVTPTGKIIFKLKISQTDQLNCCYLFFEASFIINIIEVIK